MMERQQAFQRLKQPCVHLLHVTARVAQTPSARKELTEALAILLSALQHITAQPGLLDAQLAEYAFVPISQVLRASRQVPVRSLELCLECIALLLHAGWGGRLEPALSGQLLILFTFLAKPSSAENGIAATSEELQSLAFKCMAYLWTDASRSIQGRKATIATGNIPALGEAVLVMLDSLTDSKSNTVRLQAITALGLLNNAIPDDDALASFLPKMVSSLTRVLTPNSTNRPGFRTVEKSLSVLSSLLLRLLSDEKTKKLPNEAPTKNTESSIMVSRSTSWLQATVSQVKIALANVFKLRDHDKAEVRRELLTLCLCIIQDCQVSLSNCTSMAIETIISLASHDDSRQAVENELKMLLSTDLKLGDILRECLYGWILSLPRVMRSKDDQSRRRIIQQVSVTLRLVGQRLSTLDEKLADSLRESISAVFSESQGLGELAEERSDISAAQALILSSPEHHSFSPLKFRFKGQDDTMLGFRNLIQEFATSESALRVAQELIRSIDAGPPDSRLASFWVSVKLIKDLTASTLSLDDFIEFDEPNLRETLLDDLYSHSLTILNQSAPSTETSWQFFALALETISLQAVRYKSEFKAELSEVLYPVIHHMGDSNTALQNHAMTCLNIISDATGYSNASELVVANVDYIVNAVGLKLAMGDVSPQAPQVLLMMMRLCGPSLLPYLDDLVGSIFDALERYHGYHQLTELLFSVLKGIIEEGVKTPQLLLHSGKDERQGQRIERSCTMKDVVTMLKELDANDRTDLDTDVDSSQNAFPREPWGDNHKPEEEEDRPPSTGHDEKPLPPAPRISEILLKISELTQHYLTISVPSLRISLLSLLRTTIPAISKHEDSFLPLINTLWPVLLPRLQDPEAYVASNAMDIVALMCEHARDFMRTRIEDAWDSIRKVYRRARHQVPTHHKEDSLRSSPFDISNIEPNMAKLSMSLNSTTDFSQVDSYVDAPTRMIWKSLVQLLCAIAEHVGLKEERFNEVLDMLDPVLGRSEVRQALQHNNADAVWLRLYKKSKQAENGKRADPTLSRQVFASVIKIPAGRPHWKFVSL